MKKSILFSVLGIASALLYFTHKGYTDINGRAAVSGAPGETTCSQASCHGAGGGGLADNKGPGAITISSSNMTNWKFTAGQTYHITVVNTDKNAGVFGIGVSALDNATNKSAGTLVITDATHTQIKTKTVSGSSRSYITHKDQAGATKTKPGTFNFDWKAPSGITDVTFYFAGIGANNNGSEDGGDNVYTGKQVVTLATTTGINEELTAQSEISLFPNPAKSEIRIAINGMSTTETQYTVYSINGMKMMDNINYKPGAEISLEGWKPGKYFVQMNLNGKAVSKPFIVE
jgi:hypothetical protein